MYQIHDACIQEGINEWACDCMCAWTHGYMHIWSHEYTSVRERTIARIQHHMCTWLHTCVNAWNADTDAYTSSHVPTYSTAQHAKTCIHACVCVHLRKQAHIQIDGSFQANTNREMRTCAHPPKQVTYNHFLGLRPEFHPAEALRQPPQVRKLLVFTYMCICHVYECMVVSVYVYMCTCVYAYVCNWV